MSDTPLSRRSFLYSAVVAGGATVASRLATPTAHAVTPPSASAGPVILALDDANVVETDCGKVRGSQRNGIHIFRGIPYAADTAGQSRFLPAKKPAPWPGIRSALWYEQVCPSAYRTSWNQDETAYLFQWNDGQPGEDMLRANVWTPGINDNRKRPVMVWVHGGGFSSGSGQELRAYDGEMLCRSGDVVVVGFNHRLNAFGFLNLSEFGSDYVASGNVGMTDIVFLLQWVRDNIANFGGDPANVTIMGQSGGGGKVTTLLAMPSAKGLFHRASVHSGSMLRVSDPDHSLEIAHGTLAELSITRENQDKLHTISWEELLRAGIAAERRGRPNMGPGMAPDARTMARALGWSPYVDGNVIPQQPWDPTAPAISADVPLLVGTVLNEFINGINRPDAFAMTNEQLMKQLTDRYGSHAQGLVDAFRKGHPKANPFQLSSIIAASSFRGNAVIQAQRKAALGKAPAYNFWFQWQTPILNGRPMAFHCSDLSFFFDNMERCAAMTANTAEAQRLSTQISQAWIQFARTGNPNHAGIPKWEAVSADGNQTMIFDTPVQFSNNPDGEERAVFNSIPA